MRVSPDPFPIFEGGVRQRQTTGLDHRLRRNRIGNISRDSVRAVHFTACTPHIYHQERREKLLPTPGIVLSLYMVSVL